MITRHDWSLEEIQALLALPLMDLLWQAQQVHRAANPGYRVQLASLLSVKTGGCEEDEGAKGQKRSTHQALQARGHSSGCRAAA